MLSQRPSHRTDKGRAVCGAKARVWSHHSYISSTSPSDARARLRSPLPKRAFEAVPFLHFPRCILILNHGGAFPRNPTGSHPPRAHDAGRLFRCQLASGHATRTPTCVACRGLSRAHLSRGGVPGPGPATRWPAETSPAAATPLGRGGGGGGGGGFRTLTIASSFGAWLPGARSATYAPGAGDGLTAGSIGGWAWGCGGLGLPSMWGHGSTSIPGLFFMKAPAQPRRTVAVLPSTPNMADPGGFRAGAG